MNINKQKGFTLTEMLVVIAIIGIIAAIALPAIGRAKIRSKAAVTKVEMKSLEGAIKAYKSDYERFPIGRLSANNPRNNYGDHTAGKHPYNDGRGGVAWWAPGNNNVMYILLAEDAGVNVKHARNPKKHKYITPKDSGTSVDKVGIPGLSLTKVYRSPFGNNFIISMDVNGDGYCGDNYYGGKTKEVQGLVQVPAEVSNRVGKKFKALRGDVMIWTAGPDKMIETDPVYKKHLESLYDPDTGKSEPNNISPDIDNILSWD